MEKTPDAVRKAVKEFREHLITCLLDRIKASKSEEEKQTEILQAENEKKLVDLIESFDKSHQGLTAMVLMHILKLIHNREDHKLQSIGLSIELMESGILDIIAQISDGGDLPPMSHC